MKRTFLSMLNINSNTPVGMLGRGTDSGAQDYQSGGNNMKVDKGFNLYVDITAACNAACPFCIAPTIGRIDGPKFMDGLTYGLDFTQKHGGSVQVTGGEPSLSRRLTCRCLGRLGNVRFIARLSIAMDRDSPSAAWMS